MAIDILVWKTLHLHIPTKSVQLEA